MDAIVSKKLNKLYEEYKSCVSKKTKKCELYYNSYQKSHSSSKYMSYTCKFPINFSVVSQSSKECFASTLIISIVSSTDAFIQRYSYRKSYSVYKKIYPLYFFIGISRNEELNQLIIEENKKYNDMIIFDYISSYYNNSIQFIMSMRWINSHCRSYKYLLSQQSDTFVNIPLFKRYFEFSITNYSVISIIRRKLGVIRNKKSIWYIPYSVYNVSNRWPDFPYIPHIFLYFSTVKKIVNSSYFLKTVLFMDDVYLGMLLEHSNLTNTLRSNGNLILKFNYSAYTIDMIKRKILFIHDIKPETVYYLSRYIFD